MVKWYSLYYINDFITTVTPLVSVTLIKIISLKLKYVNVYDSGIWFAISGTIDKTYPQSPGAYGFEIGEPALKNVLSRVQPNFPYLIKTICKKDSQEITDMDR